MESSSLPPLFGLNDSSDDEPLFDSDHFDDTVDLTAFSYAGAPLSSSTTVSHVDGGRETSYAARSPNAELDNGLPQNHHAETGPSRAVSLHIEAIFADIAEQILAQRSRICLSIPVRPSLHTRDGSPTSSSTGVVSRPRYLYFPGNSPEEAWRSSPLRPRSGQ